jgi:hypothetical protein
VIEDGLGGRARCVRLLGNARGLCEASTLYVALGRSQAGAVKMRRLAEL